MAEFIAFYGTLREASKALNAPRKTGLVAFRGACRLAGILKDHGAYPGLVPDARTGRSVHGDLFEILRPEAFAVFDAWEHYNERDEAGSLYLRRHVPVLNSDLRAWVYLSQVPDADHPVVGDGDWLAHLARGRSPVAAPA